MDNLNLIRSYTYDVEQVRSEIKSNPDLESILNYVYIRELSIYFNIKNGKFKKPKDLRDSYLLMPNEERNLRKYKIIESYEDIIYSGENKTGYFNLLKNEEILKPSGKKGAKQDESIKKLIDNICGGDEKNIEYLHKAILFKYYKIDTYQIPAVIFYGAGGTGKGRFLTLLSKIFGETNTQLNLGQSDLEGDFSVYKGGKLIVEFAEVNGDNKSANKIINKLKNLILAEKTTINRKNIEQYEINNNAWFFITSNYDIPIKLDSSEKGNRRFSVIKSTTPLTKEEADNITKSIEDKEMVADFLQWLIDKYPEVKNYKLLEALENEDKKDLELLSNNEDEIFEILDTILENKNQRIISKDKYYTSRELHEIFFHYKYHNKHINYSIRNQTSLGIRITGKIEAYKKMGIEIKINSTKTGNKKSYRIRKLNLSNN